ncbi:MAG: hypothetical protein HY294_15515 [Candidatus Rokubacteria bacterium]|nr:hypothetical protein [Candidatus Rokubacteria bacterium]MBI3827401.1 hypothetical protein [Candidatus Rokubacteria bacterium]
MRARLLPLALLLAWSAAFASAALGTSLLVYDDHPGQLYRLWHVVTRGPAPWAWNPDWWAGYPEMQFYPPGFAYAGSLLHSVTLGALGIAGTYQAMLWLIYVAPGLTAWLALTRLTGNGWAALPGAFVALTLSGGLASGVEGGLHIGMVAARLGWALLPLLVFVLAGWTAVRPPLASAPLVALVVLTHPAHLPTAVAAVILAALGVGGERRKRLVAAAFVLALAAAFTAFWTLPLLVRLAEARALAWGALQPELLLRPLPALLAVAALIAVRRSRALSAPAGLLVGALPLVAAGLVALDALVVEPLGLRWLPANRAVDGVAMASVLAAGTVGGRWLLGLTHMGAPRWPPSPPRSGAPRGTQAAPRYSNSRLAAASGVAIAAAVLLSLPAGTLTLWARAAEWPAWEPTARGLRLTALWDALRAAPPGRVLFLRSGVPLVYGREWYRPHTHVTALTPLFAGRAIISGTFTHPSPVAAFFYRGPRDGRAPLRELAEQLDGVSVFGEPLATIDAAAFDAVVDRLGISVIVALDEDVPRLRALAVDRTFARRVTSPPFVLFLRSGPAPGAVRLGPGRWQLVASAASPGWAPAGLAYYPLWTATSGGRPVALRRGMAGDLEVRAPAPGARIDLVYAPGPADAAGMAVSVLGAATAAAVAWRRRSAGVRERRS